MHHGNQCGCDVGDTNKEYMIVTAYNISNQESQKISIETMIGWNSRIILTHNDNCLHMIGGSKNVTHIMLDIYTQKTTIIHDFSEVYESIMGQGLLFNKTRQQMYMFGGICSPKALFFADFWICDIKMDRHKMKKIISSWSRLALNANVSIPPEIVNLIVSFDGYNWNKNDLFKLPIALRAFGCVLYDDRVIIIVGGDTFHYAPKHSVYYLDLNSDQGWIKTEYKLAKGGWCNAVMINHDAIYVLPYYDWDDYYEIAVDDILPQRLITPLV